MICQNRNRLSVDVGEQEPNKLMRRTFHLWNKVDVDKYDLKFAAKDFEQLAAPTVFCDQLPVGRNMWMDI